MGIRGVLKIVTLFAVIAAAALCILNFRGRVATEGKFLSAVIELSDEGVEGATASACFSECFYSTKTSDLDTIKVYKNVSSFNRWKSEYWDIPQTYPENWGQSMSQDRFNEGYIALVVAPSSMQDPNFIVSAACKHTNDGGNIVVELQRKERNSHFGYRKDPSIACKQIYVVIYLKKNDINEAAGTVSIAVPPIEGGVDAD